MEYMLKGWKDYFQSIVDVCPWSYEAYKQGKIDLRTFNIDGLLWEDYVWGSLPNTNAIIWQNVPYTITDLKQIVSDLNYESYRCVYFFSHPLLYKGINKKNSVPIIIQQDKKILDEARKKNKGRRRP